MPLLMTSCRSMHSSCQGPPLSGMWGSQEASRFNRECNSCRHEETQLHMIAWYFASNQSLKDAMSTRMSGAIASTSLRATCLQSSPDSSQVWSSPDADCLSCQARHNPSLLRKIGVLFGLDSIALLLGVIAQGKNDLGQHCRSACIPCLEAC